MVLIDAASGFDTATFRDPGAGYPAQTLHFDGRALRLFESTRRLLAYELDPPRCGWTERARIHRGRSTAFRLFRNGAETRALPRVLEEIEKLPGFSSDERAAAAAAARGIGNDLNRLNGFAWDSVVDPSRAHLHRHALDQINHVVAELPGVYDFENTLAVAQLRAARFEEALTTARNCIAKLRRARRPADPSNEAVELQALLELGGNEEADRAAASLRALIDSVADATTRPTYDRISLRLADEALRRFRVARNR